MKWVLAEPDPALIDRLADEAGLHPVIARLMVCRGIDDPARARSFLSCDLSTLSDPFVFSGMDKAARRIKKAVSDREKIVVYGDYDVDGVTGTALLYLVLAGLGAGVSSYIPDRLSEGYGLNAVALESIKTSGARLVISVDCGITAFREAATAARLGLDLIITDHHEFKSAANDSGSRNREKTDAESDQSPDVPAAYAVLHPRLLKDGTPDETRQRVAGLTGVGVVFKLAQALLEAGPEDERLCSFLDLVTLGTVADVGKVLGENRVLVKHGLDVLSRNDSGARPGIAALRRVAGLDGKKMGVGTVGFSIAPRINASGRLDRADTALRLLTTASAEEAVTLASTLDAVNKERQAVEEAIWQEARQHCLRNGAGHAGAIVLSSCDWHPGVIGIVSSRLVEEFYRPTALICVKDGIGKGSARSIAGFDLYGGLASCSDLLHGFGGHTYAAGFTIAEEKIPEFRERLGRIVIERMGPEGFLRTILVDGAVAITELTVDLLHEIDKLAPYGMGNPEPRLGARGLEVVSSRIVGKNHLKLRLKHTDGTTVGAVAFNRGHLLGSQVRDGARLAVVFTPRLNTWNGTTSVELDIKDLKVDNADGRREGNRKLRG